MNNEILKNGFEELKIVYTEEMNAKFEAYKDLLKEWNQKTNITKIENDEEIYIKHFLDSVLILKDKEKDGRKTIMDVGTGGGFPGIPLKIINDNYCVTLLDSLRKRVEFLSVVLEGLNLKNMSAIHGRAEDFGQDKKYRENFDICVSRAVAPLNILSEYCIPFVKVGGYFMAYKSENISEEIMKSQNAVETLGGKIKEIKEIRIPSTEIIRKIIIIEKMKSTDKIYPRKAGTPAKNPLI